MPLTSNLAKEWDEVRTAFSTSILVDTSLSSLAQNLEGADWPIKRPDETPATYIDLDYEEVVELLALKGQPAQRVEQLIALLRDTLAFDAPFGEMVAQSEASSERDNPLLKNLAKLGIPAEHPIELTALSQETREFCSLEKLTTLGQFCVFAQGLSQTVIVGGDFRTLLNALSHVDEAAIARFLPFRPGSKGLHLLEAIRLTVEAQPAATREAIAKRQQPAPSSVVARVGRLLEHFSTEAEAMRREIAAGAPLAKFTGGLADPISQRAATIVLEPYFAVEAPVAKKGWLQRLFGR